MNDELKEIINNMKEISSFEYTTDWLELNYEYTRILLDYITNLQQENENAKKLKERYQLEKEDYKQRIDKAIEKIEKYKKDEGLTMYHDTWQHLYPIYFILKGDDENEER